LNIDSIKEEDALLNSFVEELITDIELNSAQPVWQDKIGEQQIALHNDENQAGLKMGEHACLF